MTSMLLNGFSSKKQLRSTEYRMRGFDREVWHKFTLKTCLAANKLFFTLAISFDSELRPEAVTSAPLPVPMALETEVACVALFPPRDVSETLLPSRRDSVTTKQGAHMAETELIQPQPRAPRASRIYHAKAEERGAVQLNTCFRVKTCGRSLPRGPLDVESLKT
ncbi:hypothetical protein PsorP6_015402 [Peronosclerospora sorghi]|uniref:Uncharacterized protein n=1 Tax=Peronosclerospora sorghi TaxID=230839 RepID=A0ACC0WNU7_9STRA|nr:hypothetical protein PsorP6_015402 [Peronosclerospora sorghi]